MEGMDQVRKLREYLDGQDDIREAKEKVDYHTAELDRWTRRLNAARSLGDVAMSEAFGMITETIESSAPDDLQ